MLNLTWSAIGAVTKYLNIDDNDDDDDDDDDEDDEFFF